MTFEPISGNEMQIEGFQHTIHRPPFAVSKEEHIEESVERIRKELELAFKGEFGHKIVRISYRNGKCTFFISAGHEHTVYNDITDYVRNVMDKEVYPTTFQFDNFLSFSSLRLVDDENVGD